MNASSLPIDLKRLDWESLVGYNEDENYFLKWNTENKVPSVVIFEGFAGQGKLKFLAKLLAYQFCANKTACGECSSCKLLKTANFPDVFWIDLEADSVLKLEVANQLAEHLSVTAADFSDNGKKGIRVCVVLDADRLNLSASNRLLKILEELPENSQFWMTTSKYEKILPTIRSRSFHWKLKSPPREALKDYFKQHCLAEGIRVEDAYLAEALEYCRFNLGETAKYVAHTQTHVFTNLQKDLGECFANLDFKKDNFWKISEICKEYGLGLKDLLEHVEVFLNERYRSLGANLASRDGCGELGVRGLRLRQLRRALLEQHFYARKLGISIQAQMALESLSVDV